MIYARSKGYQEEYSEFMTGNNEELIYFTACFVILFNPKTNQQRFYTQHGQEVISCAVSNESGDYIATGELGDPPKIHIWSSRTLENIKILSGIHRRGVHLLAFSKSDKFLITCGLNKPSAIVIYDWNKEVVLVSTCIQTPTQDIFILPDLYIDEILKEKMEK
jgi:WD40 repeat protein